LFRLKPIQWLAARQPPVASVPSALKQQNLLLLSLLLICLLVRIIVHLPNRLEFRLEHLPNRLEFSSGLSYGLGAVYQRAREKDRERDRARERDRERETASDASSSES